MIANCGHCGIVERRSEQRLFNMLNFAVTNFLNLKPLNNLTATLHLIFFWKKNDKNSNAKLSQPHSRASICKVKIYGSADFVCIRFVDKLHQFTFDSGPFWNIKEKFWRPEQFSFEWNTFHFEYLKLFYFVSVKVEALIHYFKTMFSKGRTYKITFIFQYHAEKKLFRESLLLRFRLVLKDPLF